MKISTTVKRLRLCLSRRPRQCIPHVSGNTLQQVESSKYLGMVFSSDGSRNKDIDTRIGKANVVLCELYCSVVTKREISMTAKLLVFKSVFVPILSKEQTAEVGYLRRVLGVTLCDKKHRSEIQTARDVKSRLQIEKTQLC